MGTARVRRYITIISVLTLLFVTQVLASPQEEGMETNGSVIYQDKWAMIPKWTGELIVDGQLDEALWEQAATLDGFTTAFYQNPINDVIYRMGYDDQYLYVSAVMDPEEASTLSQIEVVLRADEQSHHVVKIPIHPTTTLNTIWNIIPDEVDLSIDPGRTDVEAVYQVTDGTDQFIVEAAIPLHSVAPAGVNIGDEWRVNIIHIHNLYTKPLDSWVPLRNVTHWDVGGASARMYGSVVDQDRLGSIYFGRPPVSGDSSTVVEVWKPQETDAKLWYEGFADKKLTFSLPLLNSGSMGGYGGLKTSDVQLYWKSPETPWQPINDYQLGRKGTEFTLNFTHPEPLLDGMYHMKIVLSPKPSTLKKVAVISLDREDLIAAGLSLFDLDGSGGTNESPVQLEWPNEFSDGVQQIIAMIPKQPGFRFVGLPEMPELYPDNLYQLAADGQSMVAPRTGTVYPNEQFKEDKELVVTNAEGKTFSIPYYEDADGQRYFITAHMWYLQKSRAISRTATLAKTDPLGAAYVLYRFAQAHADYQPTVDRVGGDNHINHVASIDSGPPYAYWGGIWDRWYLNDLANIRPLMQAYSDVKKTNAFDLLSDHLGVDVEHDVVREMFTSSADFVLSYVNRYGNMTFRVWTGLVAMGIALDEPDYIHRVVASVEDFTKRMFLADGFWKEVTLSYHLQTVNELAAIVRSLQGWSDPEGYISPRTGVRFDNLDMEQDYPLIGKAIEMANRLAYPDGKVLPIMDTWANAKVSQPRLDEGSMLLPYAGVGRLTGGEGTRQTQLYMGFQPKYGHVHNDPLNLTLYAEGQELLPDIGYSHNTNYRWFTLSTMGHNTVVVDGKNYSNNAQAIHGGNMEVFAADDQAFQVMRASYESGYPGTEEYSREPWFVPFADGTGEQGYVLDVFRVAGGSRHEYTLNGDANRDAQFVTDMTLTDYGPYLLPPGTQVVEPQSNSDSGSAEGHYPGYIYVRDVQQAELVDDQYSLTLVTEQSGAELAKMKITGLLEPGDNELYLGRSPSLRATRLQGSSMDNNDEAAKYTLPKMVLRREGTNLQSTFVTVLEPYRGDSSRIEAIDRLPLDSVIEGAAAVRVAYGDTIDILISNSRHPEIPLVVGDITMVGEIGFIRLTNGVVTEMKLVGGTHLQMGGQVLSGTGTIQGAIVDVWRRADGNSYDAIVTDIAVPAEMTGKYVVIEHPDGSTHGFEIGDILHESGRTLLVLAEHDPGFTINDDGTSQQTAFPGKHWDGPHFFTIKGISHIAGLGGEVPQPHVEVLQYVGLQAPLRHLVMGQSVQLDVYGVMSSGSNAPMASAQIVYSSSHPDVLTVDASGRVTALSEGSARLIAEVTMNNVTRSTSLMMSAQTITAGDPLQHPPILHTLGGPVFTGQSVELTFDEEAGWRENITSISVNGTMVTDAVYSILGQKIILSPEVFMDEGDHWIIVHSLGYLHAVAEQQIISQAALSDLQISSGMVSPSVRPEITEYAVVVDQGLESVQITASTYDPAAVIELAGIAYGSGVPIPVDLDNQSIQVITLKIIAADQSTKLYDLTVYRSAGVNHTGTLTGIVYDEDGLPLSGVTVNLTGYMSITAMTDALGQFTLSQVPTGLQRVTARSSGYEREVSDAVYVTDAQTGEVTIRFKNSLPPVLMDPTPLGVKSGDVIANASTRKGNLYLVPADTLATKEEIEAVAASPLGKVISIEANVTGYIDTTGLPTGRYIMYTVDSAGILSAGSEQIVIIDPQTLGGIVDDQDPLVVYSGQWRLYESANYRGGTLMLSQQKGDYVDIPFYGTRAKVLSTLTRSRGIAQIYVDGVLWETVDTYRLNNQYQVEIFDTGQLELGVHVVRIVVTGERNPEAANHQITFDALTLVIGD